ncbi:MAG: hypothetical protein ACE5G8_02490 [Anaerolineae bacterium]
MADAGPQFNSLEPVVLDHYRVQLNLETVNFPPVSNITFTLDSPTSSPVTGESPYPTVELSLLDSERNPVAQTTIIEHQETHLSLTLHIRRPQPDAEYIARAEMIRNRRVVNSLSKSFILNPAG